MIESDWQYRKKHFLLITNRCPILFSFYGYKNIDFGWLPTNNHLSFPTDFNTICEEEIDQV